MNMTGRTQNPLRRSPKKAQGRSKSGNRLVLTTLCLLECMTITRAELTVKLYTDNLNNMPEKQLVMHLETLANHAKNKCIPEKGFEQTPDRSRPDILVFGFQEGRCKTEEEEDSPDSGDYASDCDEKVDFKTDDSPKSPEWEDVDSDEAVPVMPAQPKEKEAWHKKIRDTKLGNEETGILIAQVLQEQLQDHYDAGAWNYVKHRGLSLFSKGIYIFIFVIKDTTDYVHLHSDDARFGKGGWASVAMSRRLSANKGCTLINSSFTKYPFKPVNITFLCCHNSSDNLPRNTVDFKSCARLTEKYKSDAVFMIGDFNPRLRSYLAGQKTKGGWFKKGTEENVTRVNTAILGNRTDIPIPVDSYDTFADLKGDVWSEMPIKFLPSYILPQNGPAVPVDRKLILSDYNTEASENRTISWTDRIIWRSNLEIEGIEYDCIFHIEGLNQSDHRVVYASFRLTVPGRRTRHELNFR